MKILFTLMNFPPSNFGGIASGMYPIIKELNETPEIEIKVLTTDFKIKKNNSFKINTWTTFDKIPIIYFNVKGFFLFFPYIYEGFNKIKKTDFIFLNSIFFFPNFFFLLAGLFYKKKIFILPHGELFKPALNTKFWKKIIYIWFMKPFVKKVSFITTSAQESIRTKKVFKDSNVITIPNFFDFNKPLNAKKLNQFLFLGRICEIKKIENIILACSISKHFLSNMFKLIIAGPTDKEFLNYRVELEKLVISKNLENNIEFIGEVSSPEKEKLLSQSKSLMIVSDSENFSNVVVESLSEGTPVIASKGTPWESLIELNAGFWIENSPKLIAEKIDEIILMKDKLYKEISINSITLSKQFAKNKILPIWVKLLK
jgi:glycosyltransferase involved in cell wall biosynthesis